MKKILFFAFIAFNFSAFAQSEPTSQPTNLNFSAVKSYQTSVSYSGNGSDGYLVAYSKNPITFSPTDNVDYIQGTVVGDVKIAYKRSGTFIVLGNLLQAKEYYVAVYAFNDQGANINYKSDNPLSASFTSAGVNYGSYYNNIDFTASDVVNQLTNLLQPHTIIDYSEFDENVVNKILEKDTVVNGVLKSYIRCQYSNEIKVYDHENFSYQDFSPFYSREHRIAKSWYNFNNLNSDNLTDLPEGTDYHSLALVQGEVNTDRSNFPFGEVVNQNNNSYLEFKIGEDSNGDLVAEPRDDRKGDVARAHFYIMTCYNNKYGENWGLDNLVSNASDQDIQVLLDWHYADPPDDFEKTRHEYVAEIQNNRNPFIDFPQLVDCIDFTDLTKQASCDVEVIIGVSNLNTAFGTFIYPNPSNGSLYFQNIKVKEIQSIHIYNLLGTELSNYSWNGSTIDLKDTPPGIYLINVTGINKNYLSKFQVK